VAAKNVAALLYAGLRQQVTIFLCELLENSGVSEEFTDAAFDAYEGCGDGDEEFDEYDCE